MTPTVMNLIAGWRSPMLGGVGVARRSPPHDTITTPFINTFFFLSVKSRARSVKSHNLWFQHLPHALLRARSKCEKEGNQLTSGRWASVRADRITAAAVRFGPHCPIPQVHARKCAGINELLRTNAPARYILKHRCSVSEVISWTTSFHPGEKPLML